MLRSLAITGLVVAAITTFFVCATLLFDPANEVFFFLFLGWATIPAFVAATLLARHRVQISAAALTGIGGMLVLNFLFLSYDYFLWGPTLSFPLPNAQEKLLMAFAFLAIGVAISTVCGAFTFIVCRTIDQAGLIGTRRRIWIGTQKGFTYSFACTVITVPVWWLLLWNSTWLHVVLYLFVGTTVGTLIGFLVGLVYSKHSLTAFVEEAG